MNRITAAIPELAERIAALAPADRIAFDREMDLTVGETFAYQNAKSVAQLAGRITTDEALMIYNALGRESGGSPDNGGWASDVATALKVAVTMAMGELMLVRSAA